MSRRVAFAAVGLALAAFSLALGADSSAQEKQGKQKLASPAERIMAALDQPTELDFVETPLKDVVEALKLRHGVEIQLDGKAISDAGGSVDMPITRQLKGVSLRSALRMMLRDHDLDFAISDEVLVITSGEGRVALRQYDVGDLITDDAPLPALVEAVRFALPRKGADDASQQAAAGAAAAAPSPLGALPGAGRTADGNEVDGEVMSFGTVLFVRTSDRGHMDINTMLAEMRHRRHIAESGDSAPEVAPKSEAPKQPMAKSRQSDSSSAAGGKSADR
jgi:hypothetical protein